eukprot:3531-Heterococcus_DN1.PRE.1
MASSSHPAGPPVAYCSSASNTAASSCLCSGIKKAPTRLHSSSLIARGLIFVTPRAVNCELVCSIQYSVVSSGHSKLSNMSTSSASTSGNSPAYCVVSSCCRCTYRSPLGPGAM